jgi:predicted nucleotidyltransferase
MMTIAGLQVRVLLSVPRAIEIGRLFVSACRRFDVSRLDIFGSAARDDDFDPSRSDADFLVDFAPGGQDVYFDLKETLELILDRRVDLIDCKAIERSRNTIRRRQILSQPESVYVAV